MGIEISFVVFFFVLGLMVAVYVCMYMRLSYTFLLHVVIQ